MMIAESFPLRGGGVFKSQPIKMPLARRCQKWGGYPARNLHTHGIRLRFLIVLDISDLRNPKLLITYPMTNPHGLGIDNGTLFICEGTAGLKVFDASDVYKIPSNLIAYFGEMDAYDVIPFSDNLILIGKDGLYQFDYSDLSNIRLLSKITINREEPMP